MLDENISREKPQNKKVKKKRKSSRIGNIGLGLCCLALVLGIMTACSWPRVISAGVYGLFGLYTYAMLFSLFFVGISMKLSRRYSINKKYIICASIMLFALFTAVHLVVTQGELKSMLFGKYMEHGFSRITPGGVLFGIPAFVVWNIFDGIIGSSIVLGGIFIIATAFLMTFVISKHGVNKVIKKKNPVAEIEYENAEAAALSYPEAHKEMKARVEQKYQELLQKQGRIKLDKQKSELGLTAPSIIGAATRTAIYDSAVPIDKLAPQGISGYTDELTQMSTEAAGKFMAGVQGLQQPFYAEGARFPNEVRSSYSAPTYPYTAPNAPTPMMYSPGAPVPASSPWTPPTNSPVFYQPLINYSPSADPQPDEPVYTPTTRARKNLNSSIAPGQTQLDGVMAATKQKPFKPRRYIKPTIDLIRTESTDLSDFHADAANKQAMLDAKLKEFGVNAKVTSFTVAPAITRFEVQLGLGTRANDVYRLDPDFQYVLGTTDVRMENVPGKNAIGIEVPNKKVGCVSIKDILASKEWATSKNPLSVAIGKNLNDEIVIGDISSMPHLLIAGSTGSGKSVCINTVLTSLIYRAHPDDVKLLLVDMKLVELNMYNEIPHMLIPRSIGDIQQAINALKWMQNEMQRRYKILETNRFNHISQYHALPSYQNGQIERMPYIIMVIDEAADLIHNGKKDVEDAIKRLSALARACGIHIILATQRPSVDVITAVIKTNFPVRIGFKVNSQGDSRTIINEVGGEKLVGRGDMLFSKEGRIQRVQGAYIEVEEARRVMNFVRENNECEFDSELEDLILNGPPPENAASGFGDGPAAARNQDPLYVPVLRWLVRDDNLNRTASISGIQRQFGLGFGRAGKIIDQLSSAGYVSGGNGVKVREVLISKDEVDNIYGTE